MSKYTITTVSPTTTSYVSRTEHVNFVVSGTWGSGTLAVEVKDTSGDWVAVYTDTTNFKYTMKIGIGSEYRLNLTGSTGATLTAYDLPVRALANALFI